MGRAHRRHALRPLCRRVHVSRVSHYHRGGNRRRLDFGPFGGGIIFLVEISVGQVLEPLFFGKMTGLSTFAIVASAAFWATLWGPIGLILATPLTVGLLVIGRNMESLKFFDVFWAASRC